MGFMAGFGEGFSRQFSLSENNRAAKEQDAFRLAYQDYVDKKKEYDSADSQWKKNLAKGEIMAKKYNAPPEAAIAAAKWFDAGYSDAWVEDTMSKTRFSSVDKPNPASLNNDTSSGVDAQTLASGIAGSPINPVDPASANNPTATAPMPDPNSNNTSGINTGQPPVDPNVPAMPNADNNPALTAIDSVTAPSDNAPQVTANTPDTGGDFLGGLFKPGGIFEHAGESDAAQAARTVRETAGVSEADFNKVQQGFRPPDMTDDISWKTIDTSGQGKNPLDEFNMGPESTGGGAFKDKFLANKVAAEQWRKSPDLKERAKAARWDAMAPSLEAGMKAEEAAAAGDEIAYQKYLELADKTTGTERADVSNKVIDTMALTQQAFELDQLVQGSGGSALQLAGQGVAMYETIKNNAGGLLQVFNQLVGSGAGQDTVQQEVDKWIAEQVQANTFSKEVAAQYQLVMAKATQLTFMYGKALGQQGNGFSNFENQIIRKMIMSSDNPQIFSNNLRSLVNGVADTANRLAEATRNSFEVQTLGKDEKYGKNFLDSIKSFSEYAKDTPEGKWLEGKLNLNTPKDRVFAGKEKDEDVGSYSIGDLISKNGQTYRKVQRGSDTDANNWMLVQ